MMSLDDMALQYLAKLQVEWLGFKTLQGGPEWNAGEYATLRVKIKNTTGYPLRNIAIEIGQWFGPDPTFGGNAVIEFQECEGWDGHFSHIEALEPDEEITFYCALMKAISPGFLELLMFITAEEAGTATTLAAPAGIAILPKE